MQQQPPRRPQPINIWGIALVIIVVAVWAIGRNGSGTSTAATDSTVAVSATDNPATPSPTLTPDTCGSATAYATQASSDLDARDYSGAFHNAESGLSKNEACSDETEQIVNKGFLLSMKAMAEEHLSVGDSRTDFNQADMLLEECQTRPGLYGTKEGASCETQQQYNIRSETNEDLNQ